MAGGAEAWGAAGGGAWWEGAAAGAAAVCAGREGCDWAGTEGRETPVRRDTGITIEEFETQVSLVLKIPIYERSCRQGCSVGRERVQGRNALRLLGRIIDQSFHGRPGL